LIKLLKNGILELQLEKLNMTQNELFQLYKKVQKKDKEAEDTLIATHNEYFPSSDLNKIKRGEASEYRTNLHTMYLHLSRKIKR